MRQRVTGAFRFLAAGLLSLLWFGLLGVFLVVTAGTICLQHAARWRFASTEGEVLASEVVRSGRGCYHPHIQYSYNVNGRTWTAERYDAAEVLGFQLCHSRQTAADIVALLPAGQKIRVHYDPRRHDHAALNLETRAAVWAALFFLQPFLAGTLLAILSARPWARRVPRRPAAAGPDGEVRSFLERHPAWSAAFVGFFLAAFLCNFLFCFCVGTGQTKPVIFAIEAIPFAAAITTGIYVSRTRRKPDAHASPLATPR